MMMLSRAATELNGTLLGNDVLFSAVSKDTRTIAPGDLYVAIKGEHFDGHAFVEQAGVAGAVGALVSEQQPTLLPQICVTDTRLALGNLAAFWRGQFHGGVIGVTGSNGKTTVKEMCRSILAHQAGDAHVLSTQGNLNNDIGMPMTLLSLRETHKFAVIEMGANHVGEIEYLANIAQPDVAVITNAGPAHLEGFGSIQHVAEAKAEIYGGLGESGIAIINADDSYAGYWKDVCKHRQVMTFSMLDTTADVYAEPVSAHSYMLHTPKGEAELRLKLAGHHNVMNALAAASATLALGIDLEHVIAGLNNFAGVPGRLALKHAPNGACVIDDTYNANPMSLAAAIDVLVAMQGEAWLVLGDMAELGSEADKLHFDAGQQAQTKGVKRLFATGSASKHAVSGFGSGANFYSDRAELIEQVKNEMTDKIVVLVKGSRSMAMEQVVAALVDNNNNKQGKN